MPARTRMGLRHLAVFRSRRARITAALSVLGALALPLASMAATPAGATPPPTRRFSTFDAVACVSARECLAVGGASTHAPLTERWNGARWRVLHTPGAIGTTAAWSGVWCAANARCMAVGQDTQAVSLQGAEIMAGIWNGARWRVLSPPSPGDEAGLGPVSCTSLTACVAVGSAVQTHGGGAPMLQWWNGRAWRVAPVVSPPGATFYPEAVSCPSSGRCVLVGNAGGKPTAEQWNGITWIIEPLAVPARWRQPGLVGVSCTSTNSCTAVGTAIAGKRAVPLVERWNGIRWRPQWVPPFPGAYNSALAGVSCTSASVCTAVGADSIRQPRFFAAQWKHGRWRLHWVPSSRQSVSALAGVSCTSASSCVAVGQVGGHVAAVRWNGRRWRDQRVPIP